MTRYAAEYPHTEPFHNKSHIKNAVFYDLPQTFSLFLNNLQQIR